MEKRSYAVLSMKDDVEKTKVKLQDFGLVVTDVKELTPFMAMIFGIWPTKEMVEKKFPYVRTIIVEGTEEQYLMYCKTPANDVGAYSVW